MMFPMPMPPMPPEIMDAAAANPAGFADALATGMEAFQGAMGDGGYGGSVGYGGHVQGADAAIRPFLVAGECRSGGLQCGDWLDTVAATEQGSVRVVGMAGDMRLDDGDHGVIEIRCPDGSVSMLTYEG